MEQCCSIWAIVSHSSYVSLDWDKKDILPLWGWWIIYLYTTFKQDKHCLSLAIQRLFSRQRFGWTPFLDRIRTKSVHPHPFHISIVRKKSHPLSYPYRLYYGIDSCEDASLIPTTLFMSRVNRFLFNVSS